MTHTCPNCGTLNQESYRYCANCGTLLKVDFPMNPTEQPAPVLADAIQTDPSQTDTVAAAGLTSETPDWMAAPTAPYSYMVKTAPPDEQETVSNPVNPPASSFVPPASYGAYAPYGASQAPGPPPPPAPPAGYAPPPSKRGEGATYTPYGTGPAAALERPRDTRSWLMPVIVAAAVVLLGLVFVSGYLVLTNRGTGQGATTSSKGPTTGTGQDTTSGSLPANASEEDIIKDVVRRSNDEQIEAWRNLDEEILKGTRVGQVLTENIQMVQELKQNNMYAVPENQKLEIQDVKIDGDKATVNTLEVWTVTFYRKSDNKPVQSSGPDTLTETYYLQKIDGKWMIYNLVIHDEKEKQEN